MSTQYIFIDEGGNFDFSIKGTKYFTVTSVSKIPLNEISSKFIDLKYNLIEDGLNIEYFHASEDRQNIRNKVFSIINDYIDRIRIDSVIAEKRKTDPLLQSPEKFYPEMVGYLIKHVLRGLGEEYMKYIIITDSMPVKKLRGKLEQSIKNVLKRNAPIGITYNILHHSSKSNLGLQIVDYCNWAIYRKWSTGDRRSYDLIKDGIKSEWDLFSSATKYYY